MFIQKGQSSFGGSCFNRATEKMIFYITGRRTRPGLFTPCTRVWSGSPNTTGDVSGARVIFQWVRCSLRKHEDLSSDPQHPHKEQGMMVHSSKSISEAYKLTNYGFLARSIVFHMCFFLWSRLQIQPESS